MIRPSLISVLKFSIVWCIFNWWIGGFNHLNERPRGVHQGAQCDRASLAFNYYADGLQFLYPEVHENRCNDGVVSCELPLSNYLSALLYKAFGFNEKYFRLLTFLFVSIGMFAFWLMLKLYFKTITAYLLLFLLNGSPILLFYSSNFIPDASSLGLVLVSWFLFFKLFIKHPYQPNYQKRIYYVLFVFALSFAIASKTTSLIQWISMTLLCLLSYIKFLKIELVNKKRMLLSLFFPLIIPVAWQLWARHLGKLHNSEFFMMHIPVMNTWQEYQTAWHVYIANWPAETFSAPLQYFILFFLILPFFLKKYTDNHLWYLTMLNTIGSFLFMAIMIQQFMYHDYYILCLLPCFLLNWIAIGNAIQKIKSPYWWVKIGLFIMLLMAVKIQLLYGKLNLEARYTPGNYWEQSQQVTKDYSEFKILINKRGIGRKNCVLVGYDGAPNNVLYLLDLSGRRINKDFNDEQILEAVNEINPQYLISNDSNFTARINPYFKKLDLLEKHEYLELYRVEY